METLQPSVKEGAQVTTESEGALRHVLQIYRRHFSTFIWTFLAPAAAHSVWIVLQRTLNHIRRPEWPQEGIVFAADLGSSIYFLTLVFTCAGALVYYIFCGPAIAAASAAFATLPETDSAQRLPKPLQKAWLVSLKLQIVTMLRAWWPFIVALAGSVIVAYTLLGKAGAVGVDLWYLLVAIAAFVGFPVGVWISVRLSLSIPAILFEFLGIGPALERSVQLTKGIRWKILASFALFAGLRWFLGLTANVGLGLLARAQPAVAAVEAFVLIPLLAFVFDLLIGPLFGIAIVVLFGRQVLNASPNGFSEQR
jgi:hypothetical protein